MVAKLFLGISLIGAEWVLYLLILLSVISIALMLERFWFYRKSSRGLPEFRERIRSAVSSKNWEEAKKLVLIRTSQQSGDHKDLETNLVDALLGAAKKPSLDTLSEIAQDALIRAKLEWDRNLSTLATIGSNAPFIGLFGTVLGIIKAFHDLSQQAGGVQTVTSGISEALVATAIGLLVAIPAVIAFNLFQRRVKSALAEAEALKSFLIGKMVE